MKGCKHVLNVIKKQPFNKSFLEPVSLDQYPTYSSVVALPMDLGSISEKLNAGEYDSKDDFVIDVQMVYSNARIFSPDPKHPIHKMAIEASNHFELLMSRLKPALIKTKPIQKPKKKRKLFKDEDDPEVQESLSKMAAELEKLKKQVALQEKEEILEKKHQFENKPLSKFDVNWIKSKLLLLMEKGFLDKPTVDFIVGLGGLKADADGVYELNVDLLKPKEQRLLHHKLVQVNQEMVHYETLSSIEGLGSDSD